MTNNDWSVLYVVLLVWIGIAALMYVHTLPTRSERLRALVFDMLDRAYIIGYFEPGARLHDASVSDIAYDLTLRGARELPSGLASYVREWKQERGLT